MLEANEDNIDKRALEITNAVIAKANSNETKEKYYNGAQEEPISKESRKYESVLRRMTVSEIYYYVISILNRDKFNNKENQKTDKQIVEKVIEYAKHVCVDTKDAETITKNLEFLKDKQNPAQLDKFVKQNNAIIVNNPNLQLDKKNQINAENTGGPLGCNKAILSMPKSDPLTFNKDGGNDKTSGHNLILNMKVNSLDDHYTKMTFARKILLSAIARQTKYYTPFVMSAINGDEPESKQYSVKLVNNEDKITIKTKSGSYAQITREEIAKETAKTLFWDVWHYDANTLTGNSQGLGLYLQNKIIKDGKIYSIDFGGCLPDNTNDLSLATDNISAYITGLGLSTDEVKKEFKKLLEIPPEFVVYSCINQIKKTNFPDKYGTGTQNNEKQTSEIIQDILTEYVFLLEKAKGIFNDQTITQTCENSITAYKDVIEKTKKLKSDENLNNFLKKQDESIMKKIKKMKNTEQKLSKSQNNSTKQQNKKTQKNKNAEQSIINNNQANQSIENSENNIKDQNISSINFHGDNRLTDVNILDYEEIGKINLSFDQAENKQSRKQIWEIKNEQSTDLNISDIEEIEKIDDTFISDDIEDFNKDINNLTMNDDLTRGLLAKNNDKINKSFDLTGKKEKNLIKNLKKNLEQNKIKKKQAKKNNNPNGKNAERNNIPQIQNKLNNENNNKNNNINPAIKTNDNSNVVKHGAVAEYKTTENDTKKKENTNTDKNVNKEKTSKKIDDKKSNTNTSNKEKLTESKNDKSLSTDIDNNEIEEDEQNYKKIKPTALKEPSKFNKTVKNKSTTNKKKKHIKEPKKTSKKNIFYTPKEAIHKGDNVIIDANKQISNQNQSAQQDNLPKIQNNNVKKKTHPSTLSHKNNNTPQQSTGSKILKAIEIVIFPIFLIHKLIDFLFPNDDKQVEQKTKQTMPSFDATAKNTAQKETPTQQQNNQQLINLRNMQNNQKQQL